MPCTRTGIPPRSISAGDGPVIAGASRPHCGAVDKHPRGYAVLCGSSRLQAKKPAAFSPCEADSPPR